MRSITIRCDKRGIIGDVIDAWTRKGHYYRGMSEAEFKGALSSGYIKSDMRWSAPDEGTCFSEHSGDAESYTNLGKTDPRRTGKPNYVVEVPRNAAKFFVDKRDGYPKTHERVPVSMVSRVWEMRARGGDIVAEEISITWTDK